jgi:PiT family inorganic phosphate transporter
LSPLIAFGFGWLLTNLLYFFFQKSHPGKISSLFRRLQIVSAAWMAYSHGSNDAQKTMGIITMALVSYYQLSDFHIPLWVILLCAMAMAGGTAAGGWRIIKTMGMRIVHLTPFHGFAAEGGAGTLIEIASRIGIPLSTTHVISSTIMGVGASRKFSAVRWGVAGNIVLAWILTLPGCALMGYGFAWLAHRLAD